MLRKIIQSFSLAFQNIRANFFHTFLSVLGIVIGVGALVSILSLIDGMEQYAKDQISSTTSLNMISVTTNSYKRVNGITIRKDTVNFLTHTDYQTITSQLSFPAKCYMYQRSAHEVSIAGDTTRSAAHATGVVGLEIDSLLAGRVFTDVDTVQNNPVAVLTESLAKTMSGGKPVDGLVGKQMVVGHRNLLVIGVVFLKKAQGPELFFPFNQLSNEQLRSNPPQMIVEAENVVDVPKLKEQLQAYVDQHFSSQNDFTITTNEFRVAQAAKGFFLFRVIMGLIVGISVVVGGIGVMNVLLISVTERTAEIGIRKAMGANKRDIVLLFLSEAITISAFGSFMGLVFGTLFTMAAIPIVKAITEIPFQAAYTLNTFLVISVLAVIVGIVFGTYPAVRASRLNPVDAIRHE